MPCLPRKSNLMRLPSTRVCRLRSVVSPKLSLSRAYSSLPTRTSVFSSSLTRAASTRRRGRPGSARSCSTCARILGSTRPNTSMRLYFASSRTTRQRAW